jgi:hypothetical protein
MIENVGIFGDNLPLLSFSLTSRIRYALLERILFDTGKGWRQAVKIRHK